MLAYPIIITVLLLFCFPNGIAGDIRVTLLIFSGRENPKWMVRETVPGKFKPIFNCLRNATKSGLAYHPDGMPGGLGYSGFLVEDMSTRNEWLIVGEETMPLQRSLLSSIPRGLLPSGNIEVTLKAINSGTVKATMTGAKSKREAPLYAPKAWKSTKRIKQCNNCYNYATNIRTDNFAQPGYKAGAIFNAVTKYKLKEAASRDGLTVEPFFPPSYTELKETEHLVALVVDEDRHKYEGDFHFYRLDKGTTGVNYWSHKRGENIPTRRDGIGDYIFDPKSADLGRYKFVTYMRCDKNKVAIKGEMVCTF